MDLEWEKDEHGDWILKFDGVEVRYLTNQQKSDLEEIFEKIKLDSD